jgi:hypothetical protein
MSKTSNHQKLTVLKIWLAEKQLQGKRSKAKKEKIVYDEEE